MRKSLIPILRCPRCGGKLVLKGSRRGWAGWISKGTLHCKQDGSNYMIRNGMAFLHDDSERWQTLSREADGWVRLHRDRGMYGGPAAEIDFRLPYLNEAPWIEIARAFDIALDIIQPRRGLRVLEVGAGRGWAAAQLAKRGCNVTAVEINADMQIGLGRALALAKRAHVRIDPLVADSEKLPLAAGSYDIVFASAAIHHSSSFEAILSSIAQVLRPGGRLVAINEPCLPDNTKAEDLAAALAEETAYEINENHGTLNDYRQALRRSGLRELGLLPWQTYRLHPNCLVEWSEQLQIDPPSPQELVAAAPRWRHNLFNSYRAWRARRRGALHPQALPPATWQEAMLRACGGSLVIMAEKP
ncbi:MAG: methyltransferase domain-containing protein [Oscillochloris sp.]|nr:methyltransferase domain-containing protein [Oscillochloris sp.]